MKLTVQYSLHFIKTCIIFWESFCLHCHYLFRRNLNELIIVKCLTRLLIFLGWSFEMLAWWIVSFKIYWRYGYWWICCPCTACKASEGLSLLNLTHKVVLVYVNKLIFNCTLHSQFPGLYNSFLLINLMCAFLSFLRIA